MSNTWEDIRWENESPPGDWVVEYIAKVGERKTHHLSILRGENMEEVQQNLMIELRMTYRDAVEIEVTVIRMEEIEAEPNLSRFSGLFTP